MIEADDRGIDRVAVRLLVLLKIRNGGAARDLAARLDCAGGVQQGLDQRRLSRRLMAGEQDVADLGGAVRTAGDNGT